MYWLYLDVHGEAPLLCTAVPTGSPTRLMLRFTELSTYLLAGELNKKMKILKRLIYFMPAHISKDSETEKRDSS